MLHWTGSRMHLTLGKGYPRKQHVNLIKLWSHHQCSRKMLPIPRRWPDKLSQWQSSLLLGLHHMIYQNLHGRVGKLQSMASFCMVFKIRMVFIFKKKMVFIFLNGGVDPKKNILWHIKNTWNWNFLVHKYSLIGTQPCHFLTYGLTSSEL